MKEANGLRNRLIHEYDGLNDMLAYESMKELVNHLKSFSQEVLKWMKKNLERFRKTDSLFNGHNYIWLACQRICR